MSLYNERGEPKELTEDEKRQNVLTTAITNASYMLVNNHGWTEERIHELVDRALTA